MVNYFNDLGAEVFQEVTFGGGGVRADIVVRQGRVIHVVECKLSLSLAVIEQALNWMRYAHRVSVAVPESKVHRNIGARVCRQF